MIANIIQTPHGFRAIIGGVEFTIPDDPANRHWQMVQDAIAAGAEVTIEGQIERTIDQRRAQAVVNLVAMINGAADALTAGVPMAEMLSWGAKEAAARKLLAGDVLSAYEAAILRPEADLTGETLAQLAARVAYRGDQYRAVVSAMSGVRRQAETAIAGAETPEAIGAALAHAGATLQALASA